LTDSQPGLSWLPLPAWLAGYRREHLPRDLLAGLFVAVLLVPQGMAYAQLAGLPAQAGLYAALLPPVLYALLGGSRVLSVGPVALVSLLTGEAVARATDQHGVDPLAAAAVLAVLVGVTLTLLGALRMGFLVHFISAPVLSGFVNAAALLIAATQLRHLVGIDLPRSERLARALADLADRVGDTDVATLALGLGALALLLLLGTPLRRAAQAVGIPDAWCRPLIQAAPLLVVAAGALLVWGLGLDVTRVDAREVGLPPLALPPWDLELWRSLAPPAVAIAFIAFVTATAVMRSLTDGREQAPEPNREMVALGIASLGAAVTGAYPVGGSLSRSAVNRENGARTPLASWVAAALVLLAVLFLSALFDVLPKAVLAAIILAAVIGLLEPRAFLRTWRYSRADGLSFAATFLVTLGFGVRPGIAVGALSGLALYLWRTSQPRVVIEGRLPGGEHFRSAEREGVEPVVSPVLVLRIDQSLYFANSASFEDQVRQRIDENGDVLCLLLDLKAVNDIDASALESLERLVARLEERGVALALAEVKEPVRERLERVDFFERLGVGCLFVTAHEALEALEDQYS